MFVCEVQSVQKLHLCAGEKQGFRGTKDVFKYGLVTISQDLGVCVCVGGCVCLWCMCVCVKAGGVLKTFNSLSSSFSTHHCLTFGLGLLELSVMGPL